MWPGKEKRIGAMCMVLACASVICSSVACAVCGAPTNDRYIETTVTAKASLTEIHRTEVSNAIENFEMEWYGLEAHRDPSIQSKLATGPYLNLGWDEEIYDEPFWLVITSAEVERVQIVEYSKEHFKAVALVARTVDKTATDGVIIEPSLPAGRCGVYVFVRESSVWKLAGLFVLMGTPHEIERDWNYAPDWLKETIGELPDWRICRDWMSGAH